MDGSVTGSGEVEVYRDLGGDPITDLALEGDLLEAAGAGRAALFAYSWRGPVVVLGYGQDAADVDLGWCRARSVPVLRRLSGGTGVVHARDLAVSLVLPEDDPWARGIHALYDRFLDVLAPALRRAGGAVERVDSPARAARVRSPICFEDQLADTLVSGGRKVVGCAQARRMGGVLIHAMITLDLDCALYAGVFGISEDRIRRGLGSAIPGARPELVADVVAEAFAAALGVQPRPAPVQTPSPGRRRLYQTERWRLAE
jgi:lipoate-protein ligase A